MIAHRKELEHENLTIGALADGTVNARVITMDAKRLFHDYDDDRFGQRLKFQHSRESGHGQRSWAKKSQSPVSRSQKILQFDSEQLLAKIIHYAKLKFNPGENRKEIFTQFFCF